MERVNFLGGSLITTRLGFGCTDLLGTKTPAEGLALLEAAYDAGVRHFDVAPSYGYGNAEQLVGEFARGKRSDITITTKFGQQAAVAQTAGIKQLVQIVRKTMRASPWVRNLVRRNAHYALRSGRFDVAFVQRSLENSLKALRTDHIDIYLLHECRPEDCTAKLLEFLRAAQSAGKIGSFGIGTVLASTRQVCATTPDFASVVQFKNSIIEPNADTIVRTDARLSQGERVVITHGAFTALPALRRGLGGNPASVPGWAERFDLDPGGSDLAGLILQTALRTNPEGIVLFRSASRRRIASNIRAATEASFSQTQFDGISELGRLIRQAA